MGAILGQVLLTVVTVFIYFSARTVIQRAPAEVDSGSTAAPAGGPMSAGAAEPGSDAAQGGDEIGHLGFDGPIGKGFLLIWGQTLLTIITIGSF